MLSDTAPRVTVFIPAYNAEAFIGKAIESVLAQTFTDFELLIIDDASTDTTVSVAQRYLTDDRARVLAHDQNQGQSRTRNEGLDLANGEYIALMDADDICIPDRLERQVAYMDAYPTIDLLGGNCYHINATGRRMRKRPKRCYTHPAEIDADMLFNCPIHHPTIMARRRVLAAWRYNPEVKGSEDRDLWSRMAPTHAFGNLPAVLIAYRRHPNQATSVNAEAIKKDWLSISARQLIALGVDYNYEDLWKHSLLDAGVNQHKRATGHPMDRDYMLWAEQWLRGLIMANAEFGRYSVLALSRVVGDKWLQLCKKAARREALGPAVWLIFARSPLKRSIMAAWYHNIQDFKNSFF